jgi:hypothetical protein
MRQEVIWTDLTPKEIQDGLSERDLDISEDIIRQLLREHGPSLLGQALACRQMLKYLDMDQHPDRDAQFVNIARLREQDLKSGNPIVSIDTKKKELLGTFYRDGKIYTRRALLAYDHDIPSYAAGVVIPYGIYDPKRHTGYVSVGTSKDTSEFACDSIAWWWLGVAEIGTAAPTRSACCVTAVAATAPASICSRRTCRSCRTGWVWRSA